MAALWVLMLVVALARPKEVYLVAWKVVSKVLLTVLNEAEPKEV